MQTEATNVWAKRGCLGTLPFLGLATHPNPNWSRPAQPSQSPRLANLLFGCMWLTSHIDPPDGPHLMQGSTSPIHPTCRVNSCTEASWCSACICHCAICEYVLLKEMEWAACLRREGSELRKKDKVGSMPQICLSIDHSALITPHVVFWLTLILYQPGDQS